MNEILVFSWYAFAFGTLAVFSWRMWRNLSFLDWAGRHQPLPAVLPRVSVLLPARNESANITPCVESLIHQDYSNLEVIVLDDHSSDDTGLKLDHLLQKYPQLRVIHGQEKPPEGWNGKSYACHRLASAATGEWLLFTDADTVHTPGSVRLGLGCAISLNVDMLSAFPRQRAESWGERLMVPFILGFLTMVGLDFRGIWRGQCGRTAANGQYLLVKATAYRQLGGHAAIYRELVDDIALAQAFRRANRRIALVDGTRMLSCRMYHSAREVWDGFSKNILLGLRTSGNMRLWYAPLFAWGYASLFIMPVLLLFHDTRLLAAVVVGWLWSLWAIIAARLYRPLWEVPFISLAAIGVIALSLNSMYLRLRNKGVVWKGRVYNT
jgi:chlorobactene glucosyltransferase